jgi:hypothetical protein
VQVLGAVASPARRDGPDEHRNAASLSAGSATTTAGNVRALYSIKAPLVLVDYKKQFTIQLCARWDYLYTMQSAGSLTVAVL